MKVLKILALLALLGIGTCCAIPAFLPSGGWDVEVSAYIEAPSDEVFAQVADLSKFAGWNTMWNDASGGSMEFEGEGEGATLQWNSQGSSGTMTIVNIVPGEKIAYTIAMEGDTAIGDGSFEVHPDGANTTIVWKESGGFAANGEKIEGGVGGYFMRYGSFAMQKGLEAGYGENLLVLRDLLEGKASEAESGESEAENGGSETESEDSGEK